jgi:hypothetical protein
MGEDLMVLAGSPIVSAAPTEKKKNCRAVFGGNFFSGGIRRRMNITGLPDFTWGATFENN